MPHIPPALGPCLVAFFPFAGIPQALLLYMHPKPALSLPSSGAHGAQGAPRHLLGSGALTNRDGSQFPWGRRP